MTRDDIINHLGWSEFTDIDSQPDSLFSRIESLARKAEESEREACAKVCEGLQDKAEEARALDAANDAPDKEMKLDRLQHWSTVNLFNAAMRKCAAAIRARSTP